MPAEATKLVGERLRTEVMEEATPQSPDESRVTRGRAAVAGTLAAGVALAVSELAAGVLGGVPSLVESVGDLVIDFSPQAVTKWAIDTFGTYDKVVLVAGIVVVSLILGGVVGVAARRRLWPAALAFGAFGALGAYAALRRPALPAALVVLAGALAAVGGIVVLRWLLGRAEADQEAVDPGRRSFIVGAGAVVGAVVLTAGAGRWLLERSRFRAAGREEVALPVAAEAVGPIPAGSSFEVNELSPLITPNQDFYRIDTALSIPQVDLDSWVLRVDGMVDRPYELDFEELLGMDMVERHITLSCVSNPVGGELVGTAKWLGVPLTEILDRAGVPAGADQVVGRSVDGFTVGFPVEAVYDGRHSLLAVGMNDEPLPFEHGFPARLVVAGLYGYVSATKWLSDIELTTWDAFDAYWVPRGWSKEGPVKTQSRIDTPRDGASVEAGPRVIAGVAWAPDRGISRVEVQVDGEGWMDAELSEPLSDDTWRQWMVEWDAPSGAHQIQVRATDGTGETQTEEEMGVIPDGATGWHTVTLAVT